MVYSVSGLSLTSIDEHDPRRNGPRRMSRPTDDIDLKDIDEIRRYEDFTTIGVCYADLSLHPLLFFLLQLLLTLISFV